MNKTGTSQVGAISKAQKYSTNNYWKHLEKMIIFKKRIFGKFFFSKKHSFQKKSQLPKNSKRGHSGSLDVFTNRKLQKNAREYPLKVFEKKSHIAEKNPKGDHLVSPLLLEAQNNLWFSARIEPTISCFSEN